MPSNQFNKKRRNPKPPPVCRKTGKRFASFPLATVDPCGCLPMTATIAGWTGAFAHVNGVYPLIWNFGPPSCNWNATNGTDGLVVETWFGGPRWIAQNVGGGLYSYLAPDQPNCPHQTTYAWAGGIWPGAGTTCEITTP